MRSIVLIWVALQLGVFLPLCVRAEGEAQVQKKSVKKKKQKEKKGQPHREKEAEGSEALNRFEADTVIRSQYKLNGEPLQVDPD